MATYTSLFKVVTFFFSRNLQEHLKTPKYLHRKLSNSFNSSQHDKLHQKSPSFQSLHSDHDHDHDHDHDDQTLIFNMEETLLKSSSLFPYFMLVAFEAGSPLRALLLLVLYPLICLFSREMGLKMMVMICFFGIKKDGFIVGRAVLPKFFLEDLGLEGFEVVRKCKKKVGVSELPHVMIESVLREYLEVDFVVGRELKVIWGYYVGVMEGNKKININDFKHVLGEGEMTTTSKSSSVFGICGNKVSLSHPFFSLCKEIYLTSEEMRTKWQILPSQNYPKPLIFHDGRLALRPTPTFTLALFLWLPFGIFLAIFRALVSRFVPLKLATPILIFTGMRLLSSSTTPHTSSNGGKPSKGQLYVCNHKTLLDPLYVSYALSKPLTAVTYSLSRLSEILAPIKTVRLTRDRDQDGVMMEKLLSQGDLVVCPEGTTCREPFLLRFSPLFTELNDEIVPVAMDCHVTMFYGTTASGLKCLDPIFFLLNPRPSYTVRLLESVPGLSTCQDHDQLRFNVANRVQEQIGEALSFECTQLTRKDKYLILAGNNGIVK